MSESGGTVQPVDLWSSTPGMGLLKHIQVLVSSTFDAQTE